MNNYSSIDLVICTYNNAVLLDRVLTAIAKQQISPHIKWKVLVVDNNCTDETVAVVEKHIKSKRIPELCRVLEPKQGLTYARLCGVQNTTGDWIAFVDDDCLLQEDWIEQAAKFASEHPRCGAFGGKVILDWETPPPAFVLPFGYSFAAQEHGINPKPVSCLVGAGLIVRRSALLGTGWINKQFMSDRVGKKLISGGDVELALRLACMYELWYTPDCKLMHIIPARRTSRKYLMKINYGLGISQIYGDSMCWSGSYPAWFFVSIFDSVRPSIEVLIDTLKVLLRRHSASEVAITLSFVLGRWAGIWRMFWMNVEERQALLGCAKVVRESNSTQQQIEQVLR
jgi:glycosyltransferase involved in cell wall biosynthesis